MDRAAGGTRGTARNAAPGAEFRDGGRSRLVDITDEAGIGKSRLLGEAPVLPAAAPRLCTVHQAALNSPNGWPP
ncbi:hypothetical protein [Streptomyces sp. NPDC051001]|uniref:hypothetical protein n=1 Tax=Streptomyces sp. NPDC051001 TaxID=3155795 RepID=UPI00344953C5